MVRKTRDHAHHGLTEKWRLDPVTIANFEGCVLTIIRFGYVDVGQIELNSLAQFRRDAPFAEYILGIGRVWRQGD